MSVSVQFKSAVLNNGFEMPSFGLGTFMMKPEEVDLAVTTAVECGYRLIDTALIYGNEAAIGTTLKRLIDEDKVKRKDLFVVAKLPQTAMEPDAVKPLLRKSLDALKLDYVDAYLVHFPCGCPKHGTDDYSLQLEADGTIKLDLSTDHVAIWKKMEEMVDAGWAKSIGLSNFNVRQIQRVLDNAHIKPAILEVECHAYFQQADLFDFCQKNGMKFIAYAPLGSPEFPAFVEKFSGEVIELTTLVKDPVLKEIANGHSKSVPQVLLRWLNERGMVVIPKSSKPAHIRENLHIFDFELSESDKKLIDGLDRGLRMFDMKFLKGINLHPEYPF